MTGIKIKDIAWALVDKKKICYCGIPCSCIPFNDAIAKQGEVQITLSREKLAKTLYLESKKYFDKMMYGRNELFKEWEEMNNSWKEIHYKTADAIILEQKDLFEVVK